MNWSKIKESSNYDFKLELFGKKNMAEINDWSMGSLLGSKGSRAKQVFCGKLGKFGAKGSLKICDSQTMTNDGRSG